MALLYDGAPGVLYKLALAAEVSEHAWKTRFDWTGAFVGDKSTKFINLLTAEEVAGAAEASFAGKADVMLLSFTVETMVQEADLKVKFEATQSESGGAGAFAHAYGGAIPWACLHAPPALLALTGGKLVVPLLGAAAAVAEAAALAEAVIDSDASDDGDGMEAFDQSRFDEDDDGADF